MKISSDHHGNPWFAHNLVCHKKTRVHTLLAFSFALLLVFILDVPWTYSQGMLTSGNLNSLSGFCTGTGSAFPVSSKHDKLMFIDSDGLIPEIQSMLPDDIRADDYASTGIVICLEIIEVEIEICEDSIFFTQSRIQRNYLLAAYSVEKLANTIQGISVPGPMPPSCDAAGIADNSAIILGPLPSLSSILVTLDEFLLNAEDDDNDGFSNIREFVLGSDPVDSTEPGAELSITVNNLSHLILPEGEAFTIKVSLNPGIYKGEIADYYIYADTVAGEFSYIHPGIIKKGREISVTAPAMSLQDFKLITLQGLGVGYYELFFEVNISGSVILSSSASISVVANNWQFTNVSEQAGLNYSHGYSEISFGATRALQVMAGGGVAAGDYDKDGWVDLYITRGTIGANLLFKNLGDGSFAEVGVSAGVDVAGMSHSGAVFVDYDGDGYLDLFISGFNGSPSILFHNNSDGTFEDVTQDSGLADLDESISASFADIDKDGDLDLWVTHYLENENQGYLWRNNGDGSFTDISLAAGIQDSIMFDWTANFADINNDGWPDILVTGDFNTSQIFVNNKDGTFSRATMTGLSDENGMGAAIGDYDNDGDLDWFVSSITDPDGPGREADAVPWGSSGNRFYQNRDGFFIDITDQTQTRTGHWGWGSCFADFNNDAHLDLFHVNGFSASTQLIELVYSFAFDPSRLFISDQNGGFIERSSELALIDEGQGRGIVCFDYDRDGDVDIFVANNEQAPSLFRNDGGNLNNYLHIQVGGEMLNSEAVGARVYVSTGGIIQMRELRVGNNYISQNPVEAYFGLGSAQKVDLLRVVWPSGMEVILEDVSVNQLLYVDSSQATN